MHLHLEVLLELKDHQQARQQIASCPRTHPLLSQQFIRADSQCLVLPRLLLSTQTCHLKAVVPHRRASNHHPGLERKVADRLTRLLVRHQLTVYRLDQELAIDSDVVSDQDPVVLKCHLQHRMVKECSSGVQRDKRHLNSQKS